MNEENVQSERDMKVGPLIAARFSGDRLISYVDGRVIVEKILPASRSKKTLRKQDQLNQESHSTEQGTGQ